MNYSDLVKQPIDRKQIIALLDMPHKDIYKQDWDGGLVGKAAEIKLLHKQAEERRKLLDRIKIETDQQKAEKEATEVMTREATKAGMSIEEYRKIMETKIKEDMMKDRLQRMSGSGRIVSRPVIEFALYTRINGKTIMLGEEQRQKLLLTI
jgi:hypothetical protein